MMRFSLIRWCLAGGALFPFSSVASGHHVVDTHLVAAAGEHRAQVADATALDRTRDADPDDESTALECRRIADTAIRKSTGRESGSVAGPCIGDVSCVATFRSAPAGFCGSAVQRYPLRR